MDNNKNYKILNNNDSRIFITITFEVDTNLFKSLLFNKFNLIHFPIEMFISN